MMLFVTTENSIELAKRRILSWTTQPQIYSTTTGEQRKRSSSTTAAVRLEDLPDEILVEIFLRLPSESVHRLQSVSKKLCKIVGNRLFADLHMLSAAAAAEAPQLMITIRSDYPKGMTTVLQLMNYDTNAASFVGGGNVKFSISTGSFGRS